jgi:hypothetical protein
MDARRVGHTPPLDALEKAARGRINAALRERAEALVRKRPWS